MEKKIFLGIAIFIAGLCSIVYELLVSTAATYFLGNGVKQFSIIIGVYLFSMGIGAYLSKYHHGKSMVYFVRIEYLLGLIGGFSVPIIYFLFIAVHTMALQWYCIGLIFFIGLLTGMEVPLLTFAKDDDYKESLSKILSLDYLGGLIATLVFPFMLLPFIGLFHSSILFGGLNILLGLILNIKFLKDEKGTLVFGLFALLLMVGAAVIGNKLLEEWDAKIYKHPIVHNEQSTFQKIVLTQRSSGGDLRLYLNRIIQFAESDERRYHETLIHTPLAASSGVKKVLVLGGGENLASRELLKYSGIEQIDVVDIDPAIFELSKTHPGLLAINDSAAWSPRVNLVSEDAFAFLANADRVYDLIVADLPDPSEQSLARLYSKQFYFLVLNALKENGVFVTQAGETYFAHRTFSCIHNTMESAFGQVKPFHVYIPSFGDWGFLMAGGNALEKQTAATQLTLPDSLHFLDSERIFSSFVMPKDKPILETKINTLDNPIVLDYYLADWEQWRADLTHNVANYK